MRKLYILAALLLGLTGCSEDTIIYTNPIPGEGTSTVDAELGIASDNTWLEKKELFNFKPLI